ncbi:MAG: STAS-like domain-containing protein [Luteolibacter sp.]
MKHTVHLATQFGPRLCDGEKAYSFRVQDLDPHMVICEEVVLDFTGVRATNSSFTNALICGIIVDHGQEVLNKLVFKGCLPTVRVLVQGAVDLGISKIEEQHALLKGAT